MTSCDSVLYSQITGAGRPTAYRLDLGQAEFRETFPLFSTPRQCPFTDEMMGSWEVQAPRSSGHVPSQSSQQWPRSSHATFDAGAEQLQESQPASRPASHPQPQQLGMSPLLLPGAAEHRDLLQGSCREDGEDAVGHSAGASPHTQDLTEACSVPSVLGTHHLRATSHLFTQEWICLPVPTAAAHFPLVQIFP